MSPSGRCEVCGFPIEPHSNARCPECGTPIPHSARQRAAVIAQSPWGRSIRAGIVLLRIGLGVISGIVACVLLGFDTWVDRFSATGPYAAWANLLWQVLAFSIAACGLIGFVGIILATRADPTSRGIEPIYCARRVCRVLALLIVSCTWTLCVEEGLPTVISAGLSLLNVPLLMIVLAACVGLWVAFTRWIVTASYRIPRAFEKGICIPVWLPVILGVTLAAYFTTLFVVWVHGYTNLLSFMVGMEFLLVLAIGLTAVGSLNLFLADVHRLFRRAARHSPRSADNQCEGSDRFVS